MFQYRDVATVDQMESKPLSKSFLCKHKKIFTRKNIVFGPSQKNFWLHLMIQINLVKGLAPFSLNSSLTRTTKPPSTYCFNSIKNLCYQLNNMKRNKWREVLLARVLKNFSCEVNVLAFQSKQKKVQMGRSLIT